MADLPEISIITVCRNSAAVIGRTIESICAQKRPGTEYLIIDGASTDGTQDVVRSYAGIDIFVSEPDEGIADAFNKGIQLAHGEIIGLINADDQLLPGALSTVLDYFTAHSEVDVLHGDTLLLEGEKVIKRIKPAGRWWFPWKLVLFNHPATFVRRRVYDKHGLFNTSYRIAMDVELYFRWISKGVTIRYLPEVLVKMQSGGDSSRQAVKGFREVRRAALQYGFPTFMVQMQLIGKISVWWLLERFAAIGRSK